MQFKDAQSIESVVWYLKLADFPRSQNRALVDELFNGFPPFSAEEQAQNRITTNVNWLDGTRIAHDARKQFNNAFQKPGNFFTVKLDSGPIHKRTEWGNIITEEINAQMKGSLTYAEILRNVFAQVVLHGIGPSTWDNREDWCPSMQAVCDVLLPSRTLVSMENLPYFAIFRRYTADKLWRMTHGPRVDKGWNMDVVNSCIKWAMTEGVRTATGNDWIYNPEQWQEDIKSNSGVYASDIVPTIDCWDFYFIDDSAKEWGWKRRIVLDSPSLSAGSKITADTKNLIGGRGDFLFNPGNRNYASKLSEIIHFQFADGSVVAPFRYHSVRSLGFLLYAVCHIQNRLRCKLNDAAFEGLLNYFRVANPDDAERLQKVDLVNLGIIPDGLTFVPPQERWQVNANLAGQAISLNRQTMADNSTAYTQDFGLDTEKKQPDKTATQVAAEVTAATAMVGAMLQTAYMYEEFKYKEIARRFCIKNSRNPDVKQFRLRCLKRGVPEEMLDSLRWKISAERVIGNGNKQIEMAQLQLLMQQINRFDPDAQRLILRYYTFMATDDADLANQLVPFQKTETTDSVHDAQLSAARMLLALPMGLKQGVNHGEYAAELLGSMKTTIDKIMATGGVGTPEDVAGLQMIAGQTVEGQPIEGNGALNHIQILDQEPTNKDEVKKLSDALSKLMNEVRGIAQRQAEQQQQQPGNQLPPENAVRLKAMLVESETKAKIAEENAKQKLSHKQQAFDQKLAQKQATDELSNAQKIRDAEIQETQADLSTAAKIRREAEQPAQST